MAAYVADGETPLRRAARDGDLEALQQLLLADSPASRSQNKQRQQQQQQPQVEEENAVVEDLDGDVDGEVSARTHGEVG